MPPASGQEPKLVSTMKTVTWVAVLLLVIVEIIVSLKVGGSPFNVGQVGAPPPPRPPSISELQYPSE